MEEITVIHCNQAYKFTGVLLGKKRNTEMYKTIEGRYIVFEFISDEEGGISIFDHDAALLSKSTPPQWIKWANLPIPEEMVTRL